MERGRIELLPGVFFTCVRLKDAPRACFRAALLRQLDREEAAMNALLPEVLLQGTQAHHSPEALAAALDALGRAEAEVVEVDRRRIVLAVTAYDETGVIGKGTHERFLIDAAKFIAKAESKGK